MAIGCIVSRRQVSWLAAGWRLVLPDLIIQAYGQQTVVPSCSSFAPIDLHCLLLLPETVLVDPNPLLRPLFSYPLSSPLILHA